MSAVWHARAEAAEDGGLMLSQRLLGLLACCGLVIGVVVAASGGCVAAARVRAGSSTLSTLAPIMATDSRAARPPRTACVPSQTGRSSKAKPTP
ncbi:hypothetical protein J2738_003731 [Variovorax paradoxus]|uniref:Uncharacterized protein n=1 Tax=Variovorax paradoxus TaxID=34073 RepID=A0AAE4BX10_VARPD|nr:hypothetical protein [Variovorax paradoxus]